jgi:hypothetical protein
MSSASAKPQPWIYTPAVDGTFILAPALAITAIALLFQKQITGVDAVPTWLWAILIVGVDVGHVYATLFRTYADPAERREHPDLYLLVPLACWAVGTLLFSMSAVWFWRALAYLAVFHFVRQQYGLMMIYGRKDRPLSPISRQIDKIAIYMATLYPLIYWHTHLPRHFDWFVADDFVAAKLPGLNAAGLALYALALAAYVVKEAALSYRRRSLNLPKNLLLLGTACSWFVGIVYFDNDIAFTATNVLAHGIPYIALIWIFGRNRGARAPGAALPGGLSFRRFFSLPMLPVYLGILLLLGYVEEGLWDGFIWNEHKRLFHLFAALPAVSDHALASWLVPLLALPQMTHYVLDAFIWRLNRPNAPWKQILFYRAQPT